MRIAEILRRKGSDVATVAPQTTVRTLLGTLAEYNIGAVVVSPDGNRIFGLVSERVLGRERQFAVTCVRDAPSPIDHHPVRPADTGNSAARGRARTLSGAGRIHGGLSGQRGHRAEAAAGHRDHPPLSHLAYRQCRS